MQIDLTRVGARIFFLSVIVAVAGVLAIASGKAYLAEHWDAASSPALWLKAAKLEPGNAEYWNHLGLHKEWNLNAGSGHQALAYLETAARTDPWSADLWMNLADAYQAMGEPERAQKAYENAQADYPISPEVAWRHASFLLYERHFSKAYAEIRRAVAIDPSLAVNAVAECWQSNPSIAPILDEVLPAHSDDYFQAINFFLSQKQPAPALAVWNRELAIGLPIRMDATLPLVNALIDQDRIADAQQAWHQLLEATHWPSDASSTDSIVFNGGFEHPVANGGFGWRQIPLAGARFGPDGHVVHTGSYSLRIQFDGTANLDFQHLFQYVPVEAATRYHFSAFLRTVSISTDSGMRFEIIDPRHPSAVQQMTADITGTHLWTLAQADVQTAPDTRLLEIFLRRIPSWKFDNKLSGTVWVDDVALTPLRTATKLRPR